MVRSANGIWDCCHQLVSFYSIFEDMVSDHGLYLKPEGLIDENEKKDTEGGLISICKLFKLFKHFNTPIFALC